MHYRLTLLSITTLFYSSFSFANESFVKGKVKDDEGHDVPYATVILYRTSPDSTMVKAMPSTGEGEFNFTGLKTGSYYIESSFVGFENHQSKTFKLDDTSGIELLSIVLSPAAQQLNDVIVSAVRPIVEVQPDKTVFNVEGSINATGNTALELLRKSPGVVVDNNDNLMLQGKNGVIVYIDGKKSPLRGDDLANYLKTLQSSDIDAIEIITNPSAKYDAAGNAGIVNIRLIKDKNLGTNGTINAGYRHGLHSKYNGSVNFNHRNKVTNVFGNYSLFNGINENEMFLYREQISNSFDQINHGLNDNTSQGYKFGADFFVGRNSTLGFLINGNKNNETNHGTAYTKIAELNSNAIDSLLIASNDTKSNRGNNNFNLNYIYDNGQGRTFNVDLDYGMFRNNNISYQPNRYFLPDASTLLRERIFSNVTPTDIDILTVKVDYEMNFAGGKLGTGIKSSSVITDNTFDNYDIVGVVRTLNIDRSNNFVYDERVLAGYVSYQTTIGDKWNLMGGLRAEQTNSKGELTSLKTNDNSIVKRSYLNLFPSGGITYQVNQQNSVRVNYSRRIDRPNYQNLNPFEFKLDELSFQKGNPFLKPQYSNSYSLSHTFKYTLSTSFSYTVTDQVSTQITEALSENSAILTFVNLAEQTNLALTVSYPFSITKWWNVYATVTGYQLHNEANLDGNKIDLTTQAFNFYGQNTFMLPHDFKMELSGWYNSPALWAGNWTTNRQYDISAGISKQLFNQRANLKVSISDIFMTNPWGGDSHYGELYIRGGGKWESRQVRFNLSYNFGSNDVKSSRRRKTGMEEESQRTGN